MSRQDDLEQSIRESYDIIRQYEAIIRTSDRPEEKARAGRIIREQQSLIEDCRVEYRTLSGEPEEPASWLADVACPYRGLHVFEVEHAEFYFGREDLVQQLIARVQECTFVAVVGPSGCGKSSLVRAGLTSALARQSTGDGFGWTVRFFRPGATPLLKLAAELVALLEPEADRIARSVQVNLLADHLATHAQAATGIAVQLGESYPDLSRLILVADQFEELYTECADEKARRSFVESLLALSGEGIRIVLTLRADFLGRALSNRRLGKAIDAGLITVLPMSDEGLALAVELPALKLGRSFEPGLVGRIVEDVAGEPGNLPLLEFALTELWARQSADGVLTHSAYEAIGKVAGAVARYADQVHSELTDAEQQIARRAFLQMVRPGEGTEDTRRQAHRTELDEKAWELVRRLADLRLVVTSRDRNTGQETVEVVHEALIQHWSQLHRWVDDDRDFRTWQERLRASLEQWKASDQSAGDLLRGTPLIIAQEWLEKRSHDLNEQERAFISQSLALRAQSLRLQRLTRYAILGMALAIVILLALWSWLGVRTIRMTAEDAVATAQAEARDARATAKAVTTAQARAQATVKAATTAETQARATAQAATTAEAQARATVQAQVLAAQATAEATVALQETWEAGATRIREKDGAVMVYVPAGEFWMGSADADVDAVLAECSDCKRDWFIVELPRHRVAVDAFWIDRTEVTNAQYGQCVEAGACSPPHSVRSNTREDYYINPEYDDYPVINVTWYQAREYAKWAGGRLPTEAEWEYVCRGLGDSTYPWGDDPPGDTLLNYDKNMGDTTKTGAYPEGKSWCGALDLSGNVWEWTQSLYQQYPYDLGDGREDLDIDGIRGARGGAFGSHGRYVRCAFRSGNDPGKWNRDVGFRVCVPAQ